MTEICVDAMLYFITCVEPLITCIEQLHSNVALTVIFQTIILSNV